MLKFSSGVTISMQIRHVILAVIIPIPIIEITIPVLKILHSKMLHPWPTK